MILLLDHSPTDVELVLVASDSSSIDKGEHVNFGSLSILYSCCFLFMCTRDKLILPLLTLLCF